MKENELKPWESESVKRNPLEVEKGVAEFLGAVSCHGAELAEQRFGTAKEAGMIGEAFVAEYRKVADTTKNLKQMPVRIVGPGVLVSNVTVKHDPDTGRTIIESNKKMPFVGSELVEERHGIYKGFSVSTGGDEKGYFVVLYMLFEGSRPTDVQVTAGPIRVADMRLKTSVIAPIPGTNFTVPALDAYRLRTQALIQIEEEKSPSRAMVALRAIGNAINEADGSRFTLFEPIDHIKTLATVSDAIEVEAIVNLLSNILGRDRQIHMKAFAYQGVELEEPRKVEITGTVLSLLPSHDALKLSEPTLVMTIMKPGHPEQLFYVPLSGIETLSF